MIKYLNEKGQILVIFIILLPLIILITFIFFQKLLLINEENHLKSIANDACSYYIKSNNKDKVIKLLKENESTIQNIIITTNKDEVIVEFDKEIKDLFNFFNDNNKMHIKTTCNR